MAINVEMPFEKARQQMAQWRNYAIPVSAVEVDTEPPESPNVLVDAVSLGGSPDPKQKPLVRHVLVKDLHKIGARLKYTFPKAGVFGDKAPMGLYALFDGQSCAGEPGPMAAEFCARNFHVKLLDRLAGLSKESPAERAAVEAALRGAFEDLDQEILTNQPDVKDGCGAAVALLIGQHIFTAVLGRCAAVLCETRDGPAWAPFPLGGGQAQMDNDLRRLRSMGGNVVAGPGGGLRIQHPSGATTGVSRSLGDRDWKDVVAGQRGPVIWTPEVQSLPLRRHDEHPSLLLVASSVATSLSVRELVDVAEGFPFQPRAACGEIAAKSLEARAGTAALAQCTALEVFFLPDRPRKEDRKRPGTAGPEPSPAYKKAKTSGAAPGGGTQSVRLRHILLKYSDGPQSKDGDGKPRKPLRSRQDAEAVLRRALVELRKDLKRCKNPSSSIELMNATSKKFAELCKEHSECETARKGGTTCGDMGWVTPEDRGRMGGTFKEVVDVLSPGQFSDIAVSDQGIHLVQRIA